MKPRCCALPERWSRGWNRLVYTTGGHTQEVLTLTGMRMGRLRCHARNPSGPAVIDPHRKAGHMTAREPNQKILQAYLTLTGRPTGYKILILCFYDHGRR